MDAPLPKSVIELSLVVPCFNEEDNLRPLVAALREAMAPSELNYEILIVDDGSRDNSWSVLKGLAAADARVCGLKLEKNSGQSAALWAGIRAARGQLIATMDADLQNDPRDLPNFLAAIKNCDCVCGSRVESRKEGDSLRRIISSRIANWVRSKVAGEDISDAGCCYRVFKRECVADLKFFKGIHRFLPTLIKMEGFSVAEIPIRHNARTAGESKYGVRNRLFSGLYDLFAVRWMKKRMFRYKIAEKIN